MAITFAAVRRTLESRFALALVTVALIGDVGGALANDDVIRLPSAADGSSSTITIGAVSDGACEVLPPPQPSENAVVPAVDLAVLSSFVQPPTPPEAIEPQQTPDGSRPFRPITQVTINVALPSGVLPGDSPAPTGTTPQVVDPRLWSGWGDTMFHWSATALCHRPLYFEQVNVERYGYTVCPVLQPAICGAHFFLTIPTLPYKMTAQCPRECVYTLGYYRSGSPAPRRWHHANWDPTAATVQGLAVTGLVFLIP